MQGIGACTLNGVGNRTTSGNRITSAIDLHCDVLIVGDAGKIFFFLLSKVLLSDIIHLLSNIIKFLSRKKYRVREHITLRSILSIAIRIKRKRKSINIISRYVKILLQLSWKNPERIFINYKVFYIISQHRKTTTHTHYK